MKTIVAHIRLDDPSAAVQMYERIKASIARLSEFPDMAAIPSDKIVAAQGYRMLVVEPYLVFYIRVESENTIEIHRVLHGRQNYRAILKP